MNRAYSILDVKEVVERKDDYFIKGMASTPVVDRMSDVVEPMGAQFKTPMPLLWQHQSDKPVGLVTFAKPTKDGIPFEATIPNVKEPGTLKDRIDEAVQSIKYRLVGAVSIGFQEVADKVERLKGGGKHFLEWEWLELSLVTIPANPEATITSIKSVDDRLRAALGAKQKGVARLESSPGVSGKSINLKGQGMKTSEQIASFEAKRAASVARMEELMKKAADEGRTLDESETQEYTDVEREVAQIDEHIPRLKRLEKTLVKEATPISGSIQTKGDVDNLRPAGSGVRVTPNAPKGMAFARLVKAKAVGYLNGGGDFGALTYAQGQKHWENTPQVVEHLKTGVAGGTTTASAWADDLVYNQNLAGEFIELLYPQTILGRLPGLRRVPFNIRVGSATSGGTGYWVGEGKAIPASKMQTDNVSLTIAKAAGLMVITEELARSSAPSAEALVRDDLIKTVTEFLDVQFIDPNYGPNTTTGAPGAVTYGIPAAQVRAASGTTAAALRADFAALMDPLFTANVNTMDAVWVTSPYMAMKIGMINTSLGTREFPDINMNGGALFGLPVVTSMSAYVSGSPDYGHMIVLVKPSDIFLADDGGMDVSISREASIQMDDAPTVDTPTATSLVSMWQTESLAIKLVRYINWKRRRSTAVGYIRSAAYADS
jgi:HK97 family phage major capsid protein/HK97 family phage prohead protease